VQAPNCIFQTLTDDMHIMRPSSEITCTFNHLSTQLALVRLKVKVSKCKFRSPSRISPNIKILQGFILITNGLHILGVLMGSWDFAMYFLDEVLSQDMTHINNLPLLRGAHIALSSLSSCVTCQPSNLTWTIFFSSSFLSFLASFNRKVMLVCEEIMGLRLWESF
jgi:hypothetical protein